MRGGFALVALTLMLLKTWLWLVVVRPHSGLGLSALYFAATVFMFWSYKGAVCSRPLSKRPSDSLPDDVNFVTRYCERCDSEKGPSVHHCSVCNNCVYRMDHHCPWTNNCVAWSNKKYFLLFLVYTSVSSLTFNVMATPLTFDEDFHRYRSLLKCSWVLTLGIGLLLAGYFVFHLWLLQEGKTTLEFLAGRDGELAGCSFLHNVAVYFGRDRKTWWLPVAPKLDPAMGGRRQVEDDQDSLKLLVE
ncbi:Palmitoyltransferase zdhhc15 [Phytophthora boehmeriae]|uniref:Palmitoyltransferase n=1 Tax=Phytophthora boehmeriae TaxID=109152 RepID=A0A8T1W515_9STRA|nr:Palmitoyltransferase zdhhc15 [Phytophthora boehmeriae]